MKFSQWSSEEKRLLLLAMIGLLNPMLRLQRWDLTMRWQELVPQNVLDWIGYITSLLCLVLSIQLTLKVSSSACGWKFALRSWLFSLAVIVLMYFTVGLDLHKEWLERKQQHINYAEQNLQTLRSAKFGETAERCAEDIKTSDAVKRWGIPKITDAELDELVRQAYQREVRNCELMANGDKMEEVGFRDVERCYEVVKKTDSDKDRRLSIQLQRLKGRLHVTSALELMRYAVKKVAEELREAKKLGVELTPEQAEEISHLRNFLR